MGKGCVYLKLTPALALQETVYLKLAYGLQAYPLGTHLTGIRVFHGIHVNQALCLLAGILNGAPDGINTTRIDHLLPILQGKTADHFTVARQRITEHVRLALVIVKPRQTTTDVADVIWAEILPDETNSQHQTVTGTA